MEYQNIDEAARKQACERVKQIAESIKAIRKKYYLCFNKISNPDKQKYEQLIADMQSVASQNGLEKFNAQLISEINTQFGENLPNDINENGIPSKDSEQDLYQKFIKACQLLGECIKLFKKTGKAVFLKKGIQIQNHLKKIQEVLGKNYGKVKLQAEKASILSRMFAEQTKEEFNELLGNCYKVAKSPLPKNELSQILGLVPSLEQNIPQNQPKKQVEPSRG